MNFDHHTEYIWAHCKGIKVNDTFNVWRSWLQLYMFIKMKKSLMIFYVENKKGTAYEVTVFSS